MNKNLFCLVMLGYVVSTFSMDEPANITISLKRDAKVIMISDKHTCNIMPAYDAQIRINKSNRTIEMVSAREIKALEKGRQINLSKDLEDEIMTKKKPFYFCISHETAENGFTPVSCTRITHVLMSDSIGYVVSTQLEDSVEITQAIQSIPSINLVALYFSRPFFLIYRYLFRS